jgi:hypothetical protein
MKNQHKVGILQNWNLTKLESYKIGILQNWNLTKLESSIKMFIVCTDF